MGKSSDEIKELQRSINRLQRADGTVLHLGGRAYLVRAEAVVDPDALIALLEREKVSEAEALAGLARACRLEEPARWIEGRWVGALQRDLRILEKHPDLAGLTRSAQRLFRGQVIDRDWLAARRERLDRLQEAYARDPGAVGSRWEAALVLARCFHGDGAAEALEGIRERSTRVSAERRREALGRIEQVALRLEGGEPCGEEPELTAFLDVIARRLPQVERLPGRARRRRLRPIVAAVLAWPGTPGAVPAEEPESDPAESFVQQVRRVAAWQIAQQGSTRSPEFQEQLALCLSRYGLSFPPGLDGALRFDEDLLARALGRWGLIREQLAGLPLRLEQVMALLALPFPSDKRSWIEPRRLGRIGRWMADGVEISLLQELGRLDLLRDLVDQEKWDAATVRAYGRWVTRLAPHYRQQGIQLALTPKAFARLRTAKQEDLAVLGLCLLEHRASAASAPPARQIALLDATLALFQKLPERARRCLEGLELAPAGLGERICPDFAAWLEHDPALDRYLHLCGLLGLPQVPSKNLLRDFVLAARRAAELAHLAALPDPNEAQRQRIAQLSREEPPPGPGWTKRRLAERNEALTLELLERRIDQALADILRHAFGLSLHRVTPTWRDVFRFLLSTETNRELLGLLLRNATANPGRYFPPTLPRNREWLRQATERMDAAAWLRRRRRPVELDGQRHTLEVEEDPVEVLRMGIPFGTCLSLEDGSNAASTVLNALDVNKRVLYLKDAAGALVARQLIGVSRGFTFLRYHLYSALGPERTSQAEPLFRELCEEIAREAGLPLGDSGSPESLHEGFWYDDGVEPFYTESAPDGAPVAAYCRSLGLPLPPVRPRWLLEEAELWAALQAKDAPRFAEGFRPWIDSLAQVELGERFVAEMGEAELMRAWREGATGLVVVLLRHRMTQGPEALLRSARRIVAGRDGEILYNLLRALPMTPSVMEEMASLAVFLSAQGVPLDDHGFEHGTLYELPVVAGQMKLSRLLDLCDRLAPVWARIARELEHCEGCCARAEQQVFAAAEEVFRREPDTRVLVACLRSRRRSELAQRLALHILGRYPFPRQRMQSLPAEALGALTAFERAPSDAPWVRQALRELADRRPALARSPQMLAARLRQGESVDLSVWPPPAEPPFQILGDLVFHVPDLLPWLAEHFGAPQEGIGDWWPDPWELHLQRQIATTWRRRLAREVEERGSQAIRAKQWLRVLEGQPGAARGPAKAEKRKNTPLPGDVVDAALVRHALELLWRERRALVTAETASHRDLAGAFETLLAAQLPPHLWLSWLAEIRELTGGALGPLLLDVVARWLADQRSHLANQLPPDLVLWLWSFPPLREPLLEVLAQFPASFRRCYLELRHAPRELLEGWVIKLLGRGCSGELTSTEDRELIGLVFQTVFSRTGPQQWIEVYDDLSDPLSAALFLRELARQPAEKRQEMRAVLQPLPDSWEEYVAYRFWLERTLAGLSSQGGSSHASSPDLSAPAPGTPGCLLLPPSRVVSGRSADPAEPAEHR